ncbi:MAG: universal stress protein [Proteobacteria bacterium]|nr:universal stress protein [Pseudomonadota bacterium]
MLKPTKILVPTDFSEYSDKALKQALDIAKHYNAKVYLLNVIFPIQQCVVDYCLPEKTLKDIENSTEQSAADSLQKQLDKFPLAREVEVITDIKLGFSYEEILKEAESVGIDLIVIASLGQSGMAKYFIGSVARNVLKSAKCPVLLTK